MEERDPVLERNFIIFMIISIAVIFGWMYLMGKKASPPKPKTPPAQVAETKEEPEKKPPGEKKQAPPLKEELPAGIFPL